MSAIILLFLTPSIEVWFSNFQLNDTNPAQGGQWHDVVLHSTPTFGESKTTHVMSYNIRGLEPSSVYEVIIQAKNKHGWNEVSDLYQFRTHSSNEICKYLSRNLPYFPIGSNFKAFCLLIKKLFYHENNHYLQSIKISWKKY